MSSFVFLLFVSLLSCLHDYRNLCPPEDACRPYHLQSRISPSRAYKCDIYNCPLYRLPASTAPKIRSLGLYTCDTPLSVLTRTGFYTSKLSLRCSHTPGESDAILGPDWMLACGAALCDDDFESVDPPNPVVMLLPPEIIMYSGFSKNFFRFDCTRFHYL